VFHVNKRVERWLLQAGIATCFEKYLGSFWKLKTQRRGLLYEREFIYFK
jgi:hypothetical protein